MNNVTAENYEAVVSELSSIAEQSEVAEEEQTEENLGRIAEIFDSIAHLLAGNDSRSTLTIRNEMVFLEHRPRVFYSLILQQ